MADNLTTKVKVTTINNYFGVKFWELKCEKEDGEHEFFNLLLGEMKERNITKTINGTRKVENWLNSKEGLEWINKQKEEVSHTSFGSFL